MASNAMLEIFLKSILDEEGFKKAEAYLEKLQKEGKKADEAVGNTEKQLSRAGKSTSDFYGSLTKIGAVATATAMPLYNAARQYVSAVNMAETTSRKWLAAEYDIEQSHIRIGRVGAQTILPFYQKYADLMEQFASYTEKNPAGGLGILAGTGLATGLGGLAALRGIGNIMGLGAGAGVGATASAGLGGMLSIIGPIVGVTAAILGVTVAIKTLTGKFDNLGQFVDAMFTKPEAGSPTGYQRMMGAKPTEDVPTIQETATDLWDDFTDKVNETINGLLEGVDDLESGTFKTTALLRQEYEFRKQETYAIEDFQRQRMYALEDFQRQMGYQEQDFYRQRSYAMRDFNIQFQFQEQMFYRQRAIALREFNISLARSEYDYQLSRTRAAEDHNFSLKQIMLSGDALAYYYSQRQYEIDKRRAEEDYQLSKTRAQEDFLRSQADQLAQFNIERAFQKRMFEIHMKDQEVEFQIQRERAAAEFEITLRRQDEEYRIMANRRLQAFYDSIVPEIMTEQEQRAYYESRFQQAVVDGLVGMTNSMVLYFNSIIQGYVTAMQLQNAAMQRDTYMRTYQEGGYTEPGMAVVHAGEFVLNPATTRAAERAASGTLTQEKIMSLLNGGGSTMTYQDNRVFTRGLDPDEKILLRNELRQLVMEAFR